MGLQRPSKLAYQDEETPGELDEAPLNIKGGERRVCGTLIVLRETEMNYSTRGFVGYTLVK